MGGSIAQELVIPNPDRVRKLILAGTLGQFARFRIFMLEPSKFLKEQNPEIQIIGVQPEDGTRIPGIRRWPKAYLPGIFDADRVDRILDVNRQEAEDATRQLAVKEGLFCGLSSGGALAAALRLEQEVENALIVSVVCDRGDRYLSTGVFPVP